MDIKKAQWVTDGDSLRMSMPISKVDTEKRLVSGWATLDSVDTQGDRVTSEASRKAFSKFRGNIREMHQPIAAGKMVDFKEDTMFDAQGNEYRGIFVTAKVSKGAQATWEKVLDGTLSGFSIGGGLTKSRNEFDDTLRKSVRIIDEYEITELSLVDNPANQLANIVSIHKMADGTQTIDGLATEVNIENVFWCPNDEVAKVSDGSDATCSICEMEMANIGWFESDPVERMSKIANILKKFASKNNPNTMESEVVINVTDSTIDPAAVEAAVRKILNNNGGVVKMAENNENPVSDTDKPGLDEATNAIEEEVVTNEEVATPVEDETVVEEPNLEKMFGDLKDTIEKGLASVVAGNSAALDEVKGNLEELVKSVDAKFSALNDEKAALSARVEEIAGTIGTVEKRIDGVADATALKKSGDLGSEPETTLVKSKSDKKSLWTGSFLGVDDL